MYQEVLKMCSRNKTLNIHRLCSNYFININLIFWTSLGKKEGGKELKTVRAKMWLKNYLEPFFKIIEIEAKQIQHLQNIYLYLYLIYIAYI